MKRRIQQCRSGPLGSRGASRRSPWFCLRAPWAFQLLWLIAQTLELPGATRIVAVSGDAAPDGDGAFQFIESGGLNDAGLVVFQSTIFGSSRGQANDSGLFAGDGTNRWTLAREGDVAPSGEAVLPSLLAWARPVALGLSSNGDTTIQLDLTEPSESTGIFRLGTNRLVRTVAGSVIRLPDGRLAQVSEYGSIPVISSSGAIAFTSVIDEERWGFVSLGGGPVVRIQPRRADDSGAFDVEMGAVGMSSALSVNDKGTIAFVASVTPRNGMRGGPAIGVASEAGLKVWGAYGALTPDRTGIYRQVWAPTLNERGQVAFLANVEGLFSARTQLFFTTPENVVVGVGQGHVRAYAMNNNGSVAYVEDAEGTDSALRILKAGESVPRTVATYNQSTPTGRGTIQLAVRIGDPPPLAINDSEQLAFLSEIGPGISLGLFFYDARVGLVQVAESGDPLLGSSIVDLSLSDQFIDTPGSELTEASSRAFSGLNQRGEVAYQFQLADGRSGIAVWSPSDHLGNQPPLAGIFKASTASGRTLVVPEADLMAVVSDPEQKSLRLLSVTNSSSGGGRIVWSPEGKTVTYVPANGFVGEDEWTFRVADDVGASVLVVARIAVQGANQPPSAKVPVIFYRPGESAIVSLSEVSRWIVDPDGDVVTLGDPPPTTRNGGAIVRRGDDLEVAASMFTAITGNVADEFSISMTDSVGNVATMLIILSEPNTLAVAMRTESGFSFEITALLGAWRIQRSSSIAGPWADLGTVEIVRAGRRNACPPGRTCRGVGTFSDSSPLVGAAFYRVVR